MKKLIIISILALLTGQIFGQDTLSGGYTSLAEFKSGKIKFPDTFTIEERTQGDIKAWGGNDYKIESSDEHITKSIIRQQIWGVYKDGTLYLNGIPITGLIWYAEVEIFGKYSFLHPAFPINKKIQKELGLNDPQYGYMFGAIGGAIQGANMAFKRIPLIYNIETGEKMLLSESNVSKILNNYPELKSEYNKENTKTNEDVMLKYLIKVNDLEK